MPVVLVRAYNPLRPHAMARGCHGVPSTPPLWALGVALTAFITARLDNPKPLRQPTATFSRLRCLIWSLVMGFIPLRFRYLRRLRLQPRSVQNQNAPRCHGAASAFFAPGAIGRTDALCFQSLAVKIFFKIFANPRFASYGNPAVFRPRNRSKPLKTQHFTPAVRTPQSASFCIACVCAECATASKLQPDSYQPCHWGSSAAPASAWFGNP